MQSRTTQATIIVDRLGRVRRIEPEHEGGDHDQCPVVRCPFLIPCRHTAPLLQSIHASLYHVAPPVRFPVKHQRSSRFPCASRPLVSSFRDRCLDPPLAQCLPTLWVAVSLIAHDPLRPRAWSSPSHSWYPNRIQYGFQLRAVVALPRRQSHRKRASLAIARNVHLCR